MMFLLQSKLPSISTESNNNNNNCLLFFYLFIGCYMTCVNFLIYTLIRLLKFYLRQRQINLLNDEIMNHPSLAITAVPLKILYNADQQNNTISKSDIDLFQPLIIQTQDLPLVYTENNPNQLWSLPPSGYKDYL